MSSVRICLYTHRPMSIELSTAGSYVAELIQVSLFRSEYLWLPHALRQELERVERAAFPSTSGLALTPDEVRAGAVPRLLGDRACVLQEPAA